MTTAKLLTSLLIGALLSTGALADNRIQMSVVQGASTEPSAGHRAVSNAWLQRVG